MRRHGTAGRGTARYAGTAAALLTAALVAGCGSSSGDGAGTTTAGDGAGAGSGVRVARTDAGMVLVDPRGRTLYAFAADTKGHTSCTGSCAGYWPPTPASAKPASAPDGVTATFGAISRPDGSRQLTVDGFPVYTYVGDSRAGQAAGQGLNQDGGLWWVLSPSGSWVTGSSASTSAPADGGGLGY